MAFPSRDLIADPTRTTADGNDIARHDAIPVEPSWCAGLPSSYTGKEVVQS